MRVLTAVESDLALRIRRALSGGARRMSARSRVLPTILLCGVVGVALPSSGSAQTREGSEREETTPAERDQDDGVDWETAKSTPPEDWSDELKEQIAAAGHDPETVAERVRFSQQKEAELDVLGRRIRTAVERGDKTEEEGRERWAAATGQQQTTTDLDALGRRIRAAIERGDMTPEEGRERWAAAREQAGHTSDDDDRLNEFKREVIEAAMATPVKDWSDELKATIARAGWDLDEFSVGVGQRQIWQDAIAVAVDEWSDELKARIVDGGLDLAAVTERVRHAQEETGGESGGLSESESRSDADTAVEQESWGGVKAERTNPK